MTVSDEFIFGEDEKSVMVGYGKGVLTVTAFQSDDMTGWCLHSEPFGHATQGDDLDDALMMMRDCVSSYTNCVIEEAFEIMFPDHKFVDIETPNDRRAKAYFELNSSWEPWRKLVDSSIKSLAYTLRKLSFWSRGI